MKETRVEKGRISIIQAMLILTTIVNTTGILLAPSITGYYALSDLWLSPVFASLVGFMVLFVAIHLNRYFPGKTVIEYGEKLLGSFIGKIIGAVFLLFLLHSNGIVMREYTEFVGSMFLDDTPFVVIMGGMGLLAAFATRGGIEVLGRLAQLFVPFTIFVWAVLLLLTIPSWDVSNILPVLDAGIIPPIRGSLVPQIWYSELFLLAFLLPFSKKPESAGKWGALTVIFLTLNLVILDIVSVFVFGNLVPNLTYPVMSLVRYINIAQFLQHIDALLLIIWVLGVFLKISFILYCTTLGFSQLFKLSTFRHLSMPMGFLLVLFGLWAAPNLQTLTVFLKGPAYFYLMTFFVAYPLLLLGMALIRRKLTGGGS
ncbi:MAG TPA: endospore germination permease [Bacillales bacterium]|nr:endospore germination permease [Bacillales bacterium]